MLKRLHQARLLWPAVMTLVALPILIGLGTWQLQRKAWKDGLITRLEARTHRPPVSVDEALKLYRDNGDVEYMRVRVRGEFLHDFERYLYASDDRFGAGWQVITPLRLQDGTILFVNRGFVPEGLKSPVKRPAGQLPGEIEVTGLARTSEERGAFTPNNDARSNIWFWRDIPGLYTSIAGGQSGAPFPFILEAEAEPANPGGWPRGGVTIVRLPNRHLEYVLTWFGLAIALLVVFGLYAHGRLTRAAD